MEIYHPVEKKKQFDVIRALTQRPNVARLICATDAIREGFRHLRQGSEYNALYQSAICRAKACADLPPEELSSQDSLDEMVDIVIEYHWLMK